MLRRQVSGLCRRYHSVLLNGQSRPPSRTPPARPPPPPSLLPSLVHASPPRPPGTPSFPHSLPTNPQVRALNPELPIFLLGASMGGCLCSRVGEQISSTSPMDGVILLCPALNVDKVGYAHANKSRTRTHRYAYGWNVDGLSPTAPPPHLQVKEQPMNRILLPLVGCISRVYPSLALGDKAFNTMFPIMDEIIATDMLCYHGKIRARIADEAS